MPYLIYSKKYFTRWKCESHSAFVCSICTVLTVECIMRLITLFSQCNMYRGRRGVTEICFISFSTVLVMVETTPSPVLHSNLSFPLLSLLILVSQLSVSYLNLPKSLFCFEAFLIVVYCLCPRFPWIVVGYSWFTWSVRLIYICIVLSTYIVPVSLACRLSLFDQDDLCSVYILLLT